MDRVRWCLEAETAGGPRTGAKAEAQEKQSVVPPGRAGKRRAGRVRKTAWAEFIASTSGITKLSTGSSWFLYRQQHAIRPSQRQFHLRHGHLCRGDRARARRTGLLGYREELWRNMPAWTSGLCSKLFHYSRRSNWRAPWTCMIRAQPAVDAGCAGLPSPRSRSYAGQHDACVSGGGRPTQ